MNSSMYTASALPGPLRSGMRPCKCTWAQPMASAGKKGGVAPQTFRRPALSVEQSRQLLGWAVDKVNNWRNGTLCTALREHRRGLTGDKLSARHDPQVSELELLSGSKLN